MAFIDLSSYTLSPLHRGNGIHNLFFTASRGDVWAIKPGKASDAHLFINGLATLTYPENGKYIFNGSELDFSDYRLLLSTKKKIGYLTPDTALLSNRTIRENLSVANAYFGNDLSFILDEETTEMCTLFGIDEFIENRPVNLSSYDQKKVMVVREIMKKPDIMLIECPEEFVDGEGMELLTGTLNKMVGSGMILVYLSYDRAFTEAFSEIKTVIV